MTIPEHRLPESSSSDAPSPTSDVSRDVESRKAGSAIDQSRNISFEAVLASWPGIIFSGGAYPLISLSVMAIIWAGRLAFQLLTEGTGGNGPMGGPGPASFLAAATGGTFIGITIASVTSTFGVGLTLLWNWSFKGLLRPRTAITLAAGISGYLPFGWLLGFGWSDFMLFGFVSILLAMSLAHVGGVMMASRVNRIYTQPTFHDRPFQLRITHLMIATVWVAVAAAIASWTDSLYFLVWVAVYVVCQFLVLVADRLWTSWRCRRNRPST